MSRFTGELDDAIVVRPEDQVAPDTAPDEHADAPAAQKKAL